jgi:hypothetical protein
MKRERVLIQRETEDQDSSQDGSQISGCRGRKGRGFRGKEVIKELAQVR